MNDPQYSFEQNEKNDRDGNGDQKELPPSLRRKRNSRFMLGHT